MNSSSAERKEVILRALMEENEVSVTSLAKHLKVTPVTVRADLAALEKRGLLVRTHGGAQLGHHPKIFQRMKAGSVYKEQIAKAAAGLIQNGEAVIITSGTTTALIGKYLLGKRDIHIVTNNTLLLTHVRNNPQLRVTLIGGEFRPEDEGVVGPMALATLEQFHVAKAFIGIDGASLKQGFTAHTLEAAVLVHKMAEQADQVIAIAHSGKFGKHGFARILPFGEVDVLVTDRELTPKFESRLTSAGVRVVKAQ
jgi:DeoR family galactitol utilization operon repressor